MRKCASVVHRLTGGQILIPNFSENPKTEVRIFGSMEVGFFKIIFIGLFCYRNLIIALVRFTYTYYTCRQIIIPTMQRMCDT